MKRKQCGKDLNPVQAMPSATHGVCGECCRKNERKVVGNETHKFEIR